MATLSRNQGLFLWLLPGGLHSLSYTHRHTHSYICSPGSKALMSRGSSHKTSKKNHVFSVVFSHFYPKQFTSEIQSKTATSGRRRWKFSVRACGGEKEKRRIHARSACFSFKRLVVTQSKRCIVIIIPFYLYLTNCWSVFNLNLLSIPTFFMGMLSGKQNCRRGRRKYQSTTETLSLVASNFTELYMLTFWIAF